MIHCQLRIKSVKAKLFGDYTGGYALPYLIYCRLLAEYLRKEGVFMKSKHIFAHDKKHFENNSQNSYRNNNHYDIIREECHIKQNNRHIAPLAVIL